MPEGKSTRIIFFSFFFLARHTQKRAEKDDKNRSSEVVYALNIAAGRVTDSPDVEKTKQTLRRRIRRRRRKRKRKKGGNREKKEIIIKTKKIQQQRKNET